MDRPVFAKTDPEAAQTHWRKVADRARPRVPKPAAPMDDAEVDVLAYMGFPAPRRAQLCSANPLERLNKEIKRRSDIVVPQRSRRHPSGRRPAARAE